MNTTIDILLFLAGSIIGIMAGDALYRLYKAVKRKR